MGIRDWVSRRNPDEVLLASAGRVTLSDKKSAEDSAKRREEWQDDGWTSYDEIPQLWFAYNYFANILRRARIFPAMQIDPMQPPVPLTDKTVGAAVVARAQAELDRLRGPDGTHGTLLHDLGMELSIPGEGYLVGEQDDTGVEQFVVKSIDELKYDGPQQQWMFYEGPKDRTGTPVPEDTYVARIWRPHPRWSTMADSGMRAARNDCKELLQLQRYLRGTAKSRMNAGLLLVPSEASFKRTDAVGGQAQGQAAAQDPFVAMLMTALLTPITDEESASVVVPGVVKMKAALIEKVKHLEFGREFDKVAAARTETLLSNIATSVDMPNEFVLGMADLPHWTAWFVDQDKFDAHLAPFLQLVCGAITEAYLRPALADIDLPIITWFDGSAIVSHPNRSSDADGAWDRTTISNAAYRRYKGYTEEDAPDDAEVEERIRIEREKKATAPGVGQDGGAPAGANDTAPGPASDETKPNASVTSAATDVRQLGFVLREIDFNLRLRIQTASQGVVFRALERAGAKMRRRVGNHTTYGPLIASVENHHVCDVLGRDVVLKYFDTSDEIIDDAVAPIAAVFVGWVARAQQQVRALADDYGQVDPEYAVTQAQDREAGLTVLAAGLTAIVGAQLFSPQVVEPAPFGEFDATTLVPPGLVRDSLVRAGGGTVKVLDNVTEAPQGQVATGTTALDIFQSVSLTPDAWVWVYGDPSGRSAPFLGHADLDQVEFLDWQDEVLAVHDEDAWIGTDHYFPGDHLWCQCDFAPMFKKE